MPVYKMALCLTLDGVTFVGTEFEYDIPESVDAQSMGPIVISKTPAEWGFPGMTRAQWNAASRGASFRRGPSSTDDKGRVNDILNMGAWYEGDTVGTPPITAMTQQKYIPAVCVKGGPNGMKRG